jgi:hypothetical protein
MGQSGRVKLWEIAILAGAKTADMIADIFMIQENSEMKRSTPSSRALLIH